MQTDAPDGANSKYAALQKCGSPDADKGQSEKNMSKSLSSE